MEKIIYKISIIFVLILIVFNGSVYATTYGKYGSPGNFWPKVLRETFSDSYEGKGYDPEKTEEVANKVYQKIFNKIKSYSKTKLEKLKDDCADAANDWTKANSSYNGDSKTNAVLSMINNALRDDAVPKLISGEYDKNTKASEIGTITAEGNVESAKKHLDEDTEVKPATTDDDDENEVVGDLPERKLGLITDQKEESVEETSPDTIVNSADNFLKVGKEDEIDEDSLNNVSNTVYNILLAVAIALAVIIGIVLGIKFMTSGAEGQAKIKEAVIPYIVGCLVAFSAFGIWKLIIIILNNI